MLRLLLAAALATACAAAAQAPQEEEPGDEEREEGPALEAAPAGLPDRPVMVRLGGSHTWDSNIFRSPQARAERIGAAYAGVSVDKAYAQQRFRFDATETAYRHDNFPHLDFNALNYLGAWDWRLGPRIGGTVRAAREQALADYSEFRNPAQKNVRTTEDFSLGADAWLFGGWHVTGALDQVRNRYSVPFPQQGSYRASGGEAGAKWVAPAGNWAAFTLRSLDGRYVDRALDPAARLDDGFRRREAEAAAWWRITGKSTLEGRVAQVDYRSDHFTERDFSGIAARLRYLWEAAAKLAVNLQLERRIEPWADAGASHRVEQRIAVGPAWQPSARTTLRLDVIRTESAFRDPLPGFTGAERRDVRHGARLEAEWRALRNLSLKAGAERYRQSSNDPAASFRGSQFTAGASFLF
jgi:exopolysaccharide biosynthesis operon protein EpsL